MKMKQILVALTGKSPTAADDKLPSRAPLLPQVTSETLPLSHDDFLWLHSNTVTAQSLHKAHANGVRYAKRQADYARLMLTNALDNFGIGAHPAARAALDRAIAYERACSAALTEAHKEHVASIGDLNQAQEAYLAAIRRAPREALAARLTAVVRKAPKDVTRHIPWPEDEALEHVRWVAARGDSHRT